MKNFLIVSALMFISFGFSMQLSVEKLSMKMNVKSLHKGKYISASGTVYYAPVGGKMVTHFTSPMSYLVITNAAGDAKMYDMEKNSLIQQQNPELSSQNSFIHQFLGGKTQDLGLRAAGYQLKSTRTEDNLIITTWDAPANLAPHIMKAEIAHENFKPVFIGFIDDKGNYSQKVYYSNFQKAGEKNLPMNITEIQFLSKEDSVITRRLFTEIKTNQDVDGQYLNFKIPDNADILK